MCKKSVYLDFEGIKKLLPQRYPFLMVDRVLRFEAEQRITTLKNITANEPHFLGHFPEKAIMPGAFIMEGMAQSAILLFSLSRSDAAIKDNNLFLFAGVKGKFLKSVFPGDTLIMEIEVIKMLSRAAIVKAVAKVEDVLVSRAELTFSLVPRV